MENGERCKFLLSARFNFPPFMKVFLLLFLSLSAALANNLKLHSPSRRIALRPCMRWAKR